MHFKGLVHLKMKILSVFTHPHVVPNLYVFISIKQISFPIDYQYYTQNQYSSQWGMRSV